MSTLFDGAAARDGAAASGRFAISPRVRWVADDDGLVLLDLESGLYSACNRIGALIWTRLEDGVPAEGILNDLKRSFEAPAARLESDMRSFLAKLESAGLVHRQKIDADYGGGASRSPAEKVLPATGARHGSEAGLWRAGGARSTGERSRATWFWDALAFLTLVYMDVLMTGFGFKRFYAAVSGRRPTAHRLATETARCICRSMDRAASAYFKRAWCLQRSAACVVLLRRWGYPADLVLGVRPFPFEAHAWVELEGWPLNETRERVGRFLVLDRI